MAFVVNLRLFPAVRLLLVEFSCNVW